MSEGWKPGLWLASEIRQDISMDKLYKPGMNPHESMTHTLRQGSLASSFLLKKKEAWGFNVFSYEMLILPSARPMSQSEGSFLLSCLFRWDYLI